MLNTLQALQHVVCDSTVVAGQAVASLIHAMRETEALHGRQVQQQPRTEADNTTMIAFTCSFCRCRSSTRV